MYIILMLSVLLSAIADKFTDGFFFCPRKKYTFCYEASVNNRTGAVEMNYNSKVTGQIIGILRAQRGMSQEVLSGLAGIARSHLAMIENGSKNANVDTLWRISSALGMRMSKLMQMVEDEIANQKESE